ncbi:hypothetical protein B0X78_00625 [bacterium AM6]|nr:hypothetical protein B0X78_00625 [bacterium AM6]
MDRYTARPRRKRGRAVSAAASARRRRHGRGLAGRALRWPVPAQVALKLLRSGVADPGLRQRFGRERQILARLQHPHLAQLLDAGVDQHGQPYLALDYVEGEPISDYCRRLQPPLETRLQLMLQVCAVVSHAHANLVVHRDLKPSNILVRADGTVKLLDFGIAKLLDHDDPNAAHPATEIRAFTLHYAAPEQVRGEA